MNLKSKFMAKYNQMSKEERMEILWFRNQPYTWNPIWLEVSSDTKMGDQFLEFLEENNLI